MKKSPVQILILVILTFCFLVPQIRAETITNNLTIGSRGPEVITLQKTLVAQGFLVMPTGVNYGYFGPLTKSAVAKWQTSNKIYPTLGFFGPISRDFFARQTPSSEPVIVVEPVPSVPISVSDAPTVLPTSDTPSALGMRANRIMLFRATPFEVRPGDEISLDGSGFSKTTNTIYFNGYYGISATSIDGTIINTKVPFGIMDGEYQLSVSNSIGSSDSPDIKVFIKVTSNPQPLPSIESASISGDTVTLIGSGFTYANNLFTTLGDSPNSISSNGNTLTFRITDLSRYNQTKQFTQGKYQAALWIYVQNEHGMNKDPYQLNITI